MIVDGHAIAERILSEIEHDIKKRGASLALAVIAVAPNFATKRYLSIKQKIAERLNIRVEMILLEDSASTEEAVSAVHRAVSVAHGVVIQLPLPPHIDRVRVLDALPTSHDVDGIGGEFQRRINDMSILSPVVGAIDAIARKHEVSFQDMNVLVVGEGILVGTPARVYAESRGAHVSVATKTSGTLHTLAQHADIIILGSGVPGLLSADMIKDGVVIFDAGTSEDGGKLSGDARPECSEKALLFTPVPGCIGPITVAMLFKNLALLAIHGGKDK